MATKTPIPGSKRAREVEEHGFDCKFGYHLVRLIDEVEQILTTGDLDLEKNREQLKAIRRGEVPEEKIREYFSIKEKSLEVAYHSSKLPYGPDEEKIKKLLLECLEEHYGDLSHAVVMPDKAIQALRDISSIIDRNRDLFR
jgi:hypothetical protein